MKRKLAIFLMLWLPLFMQSAWAMSTHMLAEEAGISLSQAQSGEMPCHQHHQSTTHHCNHCVACTVVTASAAFDAMLHLVMPALARESWLPMDVRYRSVDLPSLFKPPLSA